MPNEYIQRSDALKAIRYENRREENRIPSIEELHLTKYQILAEAINNIHAADVAKVRHGRWIQTKNGDFTCSLCGYTVEGEPMNYPPDGQMMLCVKGHRYCGDCGAKMDGEEDDGEEI